MRNFRHTNLGYTNGFTPAMQDVRGKSTSSHCVPPFMEKIYHCSLVRVIGIGALADEGRKLGYGGRLVTERKPN